MFLYSPRRLSENDLLPKLLGMCEYLLPTLTKVKSGPLADCEQYMIPRLGSLKENLNLLDKECPDPHINKVIAEELAACMTGAYDTEELLDTACEMNAQSVNLWYRTITQEFIDKAHSRGLAVLVFTVNAPDDLQALSLMGVDGIFTDQYSASAAVLASLDETRS